MEYYSAIKKNGILSFTGKMYRTKEHHVKWSEPSSEKQRSHVFSHMWDRSNINTRVIIYTHK
jgi:hypothetical protein